ncbi:putative nucleotide-diphospho-sugar transferase [Snodgrassella alvi]|nr:putative nucleotide-diphospho-sugar transferase [Snodgrassella alvi]
MIRIGRKRAWSSNLKQVKVPFPVVITKAMEATPESQVTVVAYHTNDELYSNEAKRLYASALRLNIPVRITVIESQGNWIKNTSFKSDFLQKIRHELRGPILYVDVDAVFHRSPLEYLSALDCDIAFCRDLQDGHLMSGTLFLQDTTLAIELMDEWSKQCKLRPDVWDQKVLQDIIDNNINQQKYHIQELPISFCWIFDRESNLKQSVEYIYIEHLQASRSAGNELKTKWFNIRKKKVQRRIDRISEVENVLFP